VSCTTSAPAHWHPDTSEKVGHYRWDFVVQCQHDVLFVEFDDAQHFEFISFFTRTRAEMVQRRIADIRKNALILLGQGPCPPRLLRIADAALDRVPDLLRTAVQPTPKSSGDDTCARSGDRDTRFLVEPTWRYSEQSRWSVAISEGSDGPVSKTQAAERIQKAWRRMKANAAFRL
jgi:hypothetical protein